MFVDTHCHLDFLMDDDKDFETIQKVLERARVVRTEKFVNFGVDFKTSQKSVLLARKFKGIFAGVGIHPCDCRDDWQDDFKKITSIACGDNRKIVAIGETGLDFYHKPFFKQRQVDAFKAHAELAIELNLPVSVHIRDSVQEALKVLEIYKGELKGVLHCFSQDLDTAKIAVDWGLYLGFGGPVTYPKNDELRNVVQNVPLEWILLETDTPFLPPQKHRGKKNFPEYIPLVAEKIASVRGIGVDEVEKVTTGAAEKLFSLSSVSALV
ncbi:TatD family hydrolase [Candidatus Dependentiae bacterium]